MRRVSARIDGWASSPVSVVGVSGTRVLLGFIGLMFYVSQYGDRGFLFGPDSVLPWHEFTERVAANGSFSLYALSSSDAWFQVIFHLGIVAALMVMLGIGGGQDLLSTGFSCGRYMSARRSCWMAATTSPISSSSCFS